MICLSDDNVCSLLAQSDRRELTPEEERVCNEWLARRVAEVREIHQRIPGYKPEDREARRQALEDLYPLEERGRRAKAAKRLTPLSVLKIRELARQNLPSGEIARKVGVHPETVRRHLRAKQ